MEIRDTGIMDLKIIKPRIFEDERGYFFESYNEGRFREGGLDYRFVQDNQSKSSYGVIRGMHYQLEPRAMAKLVRVLEGKILDVAVDLRKGSPSYLEWEAVELSAENKLQFLIPRGFAHGFSVLSETAIVSYKCDELYSPGNEAGFRFDDPQLGINWGLDACDQLVSERDLSLPGLESANMNFQYR